ncbi:type IV secretory system conjugative DNA transfer family protein [Segetibacter koreensis]|uniref:type IV secretory system conjugative DNA transfer family protein n=1 Tax=Segetibacter koreensis TaxID=398037 RepID=UPI0003A6A100|nr:type IV secretory system conjugative DNA transfer family protein [Segetibacter koreensis]
MEQLEGQIGTTKIGMARLASPQLYWVLSGSDFTLDINDPKHPKIVCMANNPEKQLIYGAVLSLYVTRLTRQVNKKGRLKWSLVFDEFPTIFFNHIDSLIANARSNKVATTLAMQDFSQLKKEYGKDQADLIMNVTGNIISGQVMGETAKQLSERFGKILQEREGVSINRIDTSVSRSTQLDFAIPASKIASLSSGEFVGMVADDPDKKIRLKMFHAEIINDPTKLDEEARKYKDLPVVSNVSEQQVMDNYFQIKLDVTKIISKGVSQLKKERQDEENL